MARVTLGRRDHNWKCVRKGSRMRRHAPWIAAVWLVKGAVRENSDGDVSDRFEESSAGNVTGGGYCGGC